MYSLIVFAKDPVPGTVKTRLTPFLTPEEAARLYSAFLLDTIACARTSDRLETHVAFSPSESLASIRNMVGGQVASLFPQTGTTLGQKLWDAFVHAFEFGAEGVLIVGSDCPSLQATVLDQACDLLRHRDVVLGPAVDGGYYLIGLAGNPDAIYKYSSLFQNISWSTETVYPQTTAAIEAASLTFSELPLLSDVDQPRDLVSLSRVLDGYRSSGDNLTGAQTEERLSEFKERLREIV